MSLLVVDNLRKTYPGTGKTRPVEAVRGISFDLYPGESLGLVGESGCGKSVSALAVLRLIQCPPVG